MWPIGWAALTIALSCPALAFGQEIGVDLGTLGGVSAQAHAITTCGVATGVSNLADGSNGAFRVRAPGSMTCVPMLPGTANAWGIGINERNDVAGLAEAPDFSSHAIVVSRAGVRDLGPGNANDVNNLGQVAGTTSVGSLAHATRWDASGRPHLLPVGDAFYSIANAINDRGQVAGFIAVSGGYSRAVLWNGDAEPLDLGTLGGGNAEALGINEAGDVAGISENAMGQSVAFLWRAGSGMVDILSGDTGGAWDVNDVGQVVGSHVVDGNSVAFVWSEAQGVTNLWSTAPPELLRASSVNDLGEIVGMVYDRPGMRIAALRWRVAPAPARQLDALDRALARLRTDGVLRRAQSMPMRAALAGARRGLERSDRGVAAHHLRVLAMLLERASRGSRSAIDFPLALATRLAHRLDARRAHAAVSWCDALPNARR
jgi:probable HAF family extracellular repeat protein